MKSLLTRRRFVRSTAAGIAALASFGSRYVPRVFATGDKNKLAIDGGTPVRKGGRNNMLHYKYYGPQFYDDVEKRELLEVLESREPFRFGRRESTSKTLEFEKNYAAHLGVKHALGVTSGTAALAVALGALGIGPGDEVILPAWTWYADYDTTVLAGALPVFAEIDESFSIDPQDIEHRITPRTKAIIPSNLQGGVADMDPIMEIASKHNIPVLEDFSQCIGGRYKGKYLGTMGRIGINSFQASKVVTSGEGGAVVTNDDELFERAIYFHGTGLFSPYREELNGGSMQMGFSRYHFRMNEFTGAVLKGQEQKLETICSRLRANARKVREGIADLPGLKLRKSHDQEGDLGVTVYLDHGSRRQRDLFHRALAAEGIRPSGPTGSVILPTIPRIENKQTVHPDLPPFNTPQGKAIRYGAECCPRTIDIINRFGGVIMDPNFSEKDVDDIIKAIRKVYLARKTV